VVDVEERGRIIHDTPGRLRVRVGRRYRRRAVMDQVRDRLEQQPGVDMVTTNAATGSVLVNYDRRACSAADILALLHDAGLIVLGVTGAAGDGLATSGNSTTSESLIDALDDLDRHLSTWTGGKLDLKLLCPLTLGAIGVWKWLHQGLGLNTAPAYLLLWYAFDSFFKLHLQRRQASTAPDE